MSDRPMPCSQVPAAVRPSGSSPADLDRSVARIRRTCDLIRRCALLLALLYLLGTLACLWSVWACANEALVSGASNLREALYLRLDSGLAWSGGTLFSASSGGILGRTENVGATWEYSAIQSLASGLPGMVLALAVAVVSARLFGWVCESGRPFSDRVAHDIRVIGWLLVAGGVMPFVTSVIAFGLRPENVSVRLSGGDAGSVVAALLVFAIARVFDYGIALQRRDDETL